MAASCPSPKAPERAEAILARSVRSSPHSIMARRRWRAVHSEDYRLPLGRRTRMAGGGARGRRERLCLAGRAPPPAPNRSDRRRARQYTSTPPRRSRRDLEGAYWSAQTASARWTRFERRARGVRLVRPPGHHCGRTISQLLYLKQRRIAAQRDRCGPAQDRNPRCRIIITARDAGHLNDRSDVLFVSIHADR